MTCDGVLRDAFELNGTRQDVEVWSLLATDLKPETNEPPTTAHKPAADADLGNPGVP